MVVSSVRSASGHGIAPMVCRIILWMELVQMVRYGVITAVRAMFGGGHMPLEYP